MIEICFEQYLTSAVEVWEGNYSGDHASLIDNLLLVQEPWRVGRDGRLVGVPLGRKSC